MSEQANQPTDPTDLDKGDDHAGKTVMTPDVKADIARGHEEDVIPLTPMIITGGIIAAVCTLTYVIVTFVVGATAENTSDPDNELAAEKNAAPLPERIARINSDDPAAEVTQPRLEGMEIPVPNGKVNVRPQIPQVQGNSPRYHPEDLRPGNYAGLKKFAWKDQENDVAAIPIADAMSAILANKDQFLKSAKKEDPEGGGKPEPAPTAANGGQGGGKIDR